MRIVQLGKYYPPEPGGIEQVTEFSARALSAEHEVVVLCHNTKLGRLEERRGDIRVIRCSTQGIFFKQPVSFGMGRELRALKPDLIHFHAPNFWAAAMVLLYTPDVPVVISHHMDIGGRKLLKFLLLPLYRHLVAKSRSVIVSSAKNAAISTDLPSQIGRVAVIPFGLDESKFDLSGERQQRVAEEKAMLFGNDVVIGFVGRFVWYKGLQELIQALARQRNCRLLMIGDGPLRSMVERLVASQGLADRVMLAGTVSEQRKIDLMAMFDMLAFPSTHIAEAFGLSQVEAQFCAKPVIATLLPSGASDITVDGETGLLVPPGNVDALVEAIERLAGDAATRKRMGIKGRQRALDHYTHHSYIKRLRAEINQVCSREEVLDTV